MNNSKVYDIVTERILNLIESSDKLVWQRGWNGGSKPMNYVSKKPYRGFNAMLTSFLYESPYYLTYKQVRDLGGKVKQGAKGVPIIYWNWLYFDENGKKVKTREEATKVVPLLRYFNVFNEEFIEGIDFKHEAVTPLSEAQRKANCEDLIAKLVADKGLQIDNNGNGKAYYVPSKDSVHMPTFKSFKSAESYYSVAFHEIVHWTGHSSRMKRGLDTSLAPFGKTDYSKEELVAEMGATFLCEEMQISNEQLNVNSAAYLKSWLKALKNDTSLLVSASGKAQKAVDFILD